MPGITSSASKAAQGSPTHIVTSNAGGDLAAYTPSELGLASTGDVSGLQTQINSLGRRDKELTEGVASVASLAQAVLLPGQHFAMRAGWGGFDDASAVGFSAAGVVAIICCDPDTARSLSIVASALAPIKGRSRAAPACRLAGSRSQAKASVSRLDNPWQEPS